VACVLFFVLLALARSADVPRSGYGVKSDEATYVAMALSVAYDGDLTYEKTDLERFAGLYHSGPNGIFLKRGKHVRVEFGGAFPFARLTKRDDTNPNRLYYGKAFIYPLLAAPLVRLYGLNGLLMFNVLLLAVAVICAYAFLAAESPPATAALFTSAFFGAAALPVYGVFLMPDVFNLAMVLVAYFLWLYKEVRVGLKADPTYEPTPVVVGPGVGSDFSRTVGGGSSNVRARASTNSGLIAWKGSQRLATIPGSTFASAMKACGSRARGSRRPAIKYFPSRVPVSVTTTPGSFFTLST